MPEWLKDISLFAVPILGAIATLFYRRNHKREKRSRITQEELEEAKEEVAKETKEAIDAINKQADADMDDIRDRFGE